MKKKNKRGSLNPLFYCNIANNSSSCPDSSQINLYKIINLEHQDSL